MTLVERHNRTVRPASHSARPISTHCRTALQVTPSSVGARQHRPRRGTGCRRHRHSAGYRTPERAPGASPVLWRRHQLQHRRRVETNFQTADLSARPGAEHRPAYRAEEETAYADVFFPRPNRSAATASAPWCRPPTSRACARAHRHRRSAGLARRAVRDAPVADLAGRAAGARRRSGQHQPGAGAERGVDLAPG